MTKEQRAEALLRVEAFWEWPVSMPYPSNARDAAVRKQIWGTLPARHDSIEIWAGMALSEVGALGFDMEDVEVWDRESKTWRKP